MPRDSQRQKVYDAERILQADRWTAEFDPMTIEECQRYVDRITRSKWWAKRAGQNLPVYVKAGRGGGHAIPWMRTIELGVWARQPIVILHELAHILTGPSGSITGKHRSHGRTFTRHLLALVRRWMGQAEERALKNSYDNHNVLWRLPRGKPTGNGEVKRCAECNRFVGKAQHHCPEPSSLDA